MIKIKDTFNGKVRFALLACLCSAIFLKIENDN
jgi:hypothetical protein